MLFFLEGRGNAARVDSLFRQAHLSKTPVFMSVVNWGEVYYTEWQERGQDHAELIRHSMARLPIVLVPADEEISLHAARLKAKHKIPFADAFAAATALRHDATLVTADPDFKKLGSQIKIMWLAKS